MNKEFAPYEEALVLKELGFDEPCLGAYFIAEKQLHICEYRKDNKYMILAPTFSQAFRWFREKYNLYCFTLRQVGTNTGDIFFISSYYKGKKGNSPMNTCIPSKTYEEAELACLRKLIETVKEKHNEQQ
jgi:hypothetical protein